jgi:WD40 repeat protein
VRPEPRLIGQRFGPYELRDWVASGGMGSVYRAVRVDDFEQEVAVKVVRQALDDADAARRFATERQLLAGLSHPNIARLLDGGTTAEGLPYFVMEFIRGLPIDRHCDRAQLTTRDRVHLLEAVCQAVACTHEQGIIHRDLKPSNVLVTQDGVPKLLDFGLAKWVADDSGATRTGQVLGTPSYMAPEQALGKARDVTERADVYSLGAILYELLTGRPPFKGSTWRETLEQVCTEEPVAPRRLQPKLPRDLDTICLKCLQKDPARRYASARQLGEDLDRFLRGEPILARPAGRIERLGRWCRRNPGVASLTALVVLLLVGGTVAASVAALAFRRAAEQERFLSGTLQQTNEELASALYTRSIAVAERELSLRRDIAYAEELLEGCPAPLRGWEWHHLRRLLDGPTSVLKGHTAGIWSVACCPGRRLLASGSIDGTVRLWDADKEILSRTLPGSFLYPVICVAFSPDGKRLVAGGVAPNLLQPQSSTGVVKVWEVESGRLLRTYPAHPGLVAGVAFSPDGRTVASAGFGDVVHLWDADTGATKQVLRGHSNWVNRPAFRPDGALLATPSMDGTVKVWDVATGRELGTLRGHDGPVRDAEFSRDGRLLATAGMDGTVKVWDVPSGKATLTFVGHSMSALTVAFSPDGKRLASGGFDKTVKVWDVAAGKEAITLRGHTDFITSVAFSDDGYLLASVSFDKTVRLWDATPRRAGGAAARVLRGHSERVNAVVVSPVGKYLASSSWDRTVRLWDRGSGKEVRALRGHESSVWGLAFRPDGRVLASASWDRTVRLWDVASGREVRVLAGHGTGVYAVAFHPDGKRLAAGCLDGVVRIWDTEAGSEVRSVRAHLALAYAVAFTPDGRTMATGGSDRTVKLWETETWQVRQTLRHEMSVHGLAFRSDGKVIASASWDQSVKLWDVATGKLTQTLRGHTDRVYAVAFDRSGDYLASAGEDKAVRVWDLKTGREAVPPRLHRGIVWGVAFYPDGKRLASACWYPRAGVAVWRALP